jgi:uncharacterized protein YciI
MFVVLSRYTAPLAEIDALMAEHRAWLAPLYERGVFVLTGRREPRTGAVMIARGLTLEELDATLAEDPFRRAGLLQHEVIEFIASGTHPGLAWLKE